jgi:transposase/FtsZ-binding cell division protein ZapB
MEETVTITRSEYEFLKSLEPKVKELVSLVVSLQTEIALLKGGKNSRTSSTSPSQDLCRSNTKSLREKSGKKSGGQPGHTGHSLPLSDTPTEIIPHYPHQCKHCGTTLHNTESTLLTRRQIVDIPPVSLMYTEHQIYECCCPACGTKNIGDFPEDVTAPIQYGPRIEANVGYLSVYQCLPYKRICALFKDFWGIRLSQGSVDNFLKKLSKKATPAYDDIKTRILQSPVVGADETGTRVNGKKHWFHVWQTNLLTFIVSFASRGYKVIEEYFKDGLKFSIYVSDCWSSQLKVPAMAHQLCMVHLLRELNNFVDNINSQWSYNLKKLFQRAIQLKSQMTEADYLNPPVEIATINAELDTLLGTDCSKFHEKEQAFIKRLIKHRQSIFTFLKYQYVPHDNNASERAIRNVKIKTKVSGQFRNNEGNGADRYAKIRSVIDTSIKNEDDVYAALFKIAKLKYVRE